MGRRGYPAEFRRRVLDLLTAGRRVADLAYAGSIALRFMTNGSIPGSVSYRILERTGDEPWPIAVSAVDCALRVQSSRLGPGSGPSLPDSAQSTASWE
jgi:hypothetical protein